MANITREEEQKIREWQARTGGGCLDRVETQEEAIKRTEHEAKVALRKLREFNLSQK